MSIVSPSWIQAITGVLILIIMAIGLYLDIKRRLGAGGNPSPAGSNPPTASSFIHRKAFLVPLIVIVILIITVPALSLVAQMIPIKNNQIRQDMIYEDTRITKESEDCVINHVQYNSEKTSQKITFYLAPPVVQDEIIKDAMDCARNNKFLFSPKMQNNEYVHYEIVERYVDETPKNIIPLLLTKDEWTDITQCVYDAGGFGKDLMILMRTVLNDRAIMRNLEYKFEVKSEEIHLSYYDKIGIMAGYLNMQKKKV